MCTSPCMEDPSKLCCWVPSVVSQIFGCCHQLKCCADDDVTQRVNASVHTPCVDSHATCPQLKKQLDAIGGSCLTDDMGKVTGIPTLSGLHLADQCCKSCCDARCRRCVAFGSVAQCSGVLGVDCSCAAQPKDRRRGQAVAAAAVQVNGHETSREQLAGVTSCLDDIGEAQGAHSSATRHRALAGENAIAEHRACALSGHVHARQLTVSQAHATSHHTAGQRHCDDDAASLSAKYGGSVSCAHYKSMGEGLGTLMWILTMIVVNVPASARL